MQKASLLSLLSLFLSLPLIYALPHISTTPLTLTLPITGFQHQLYNYTLITDQIYNVLSHTSFHINTRWYYRNEYVVPHEIGILCGADQIHIISNKHNVKLTINGHRMTHGYTHVGNLLMHHSHENSNTSIEIMTDDDKHIRSIIMASSLFAIKMDITSHHTISLSLALLSRDWIRRGRLSENIDDIPLHGLIGQTWKYNDGHMDGDEHDYVMSSLWSTDGIYSRYRDDLYNHIDE